MVLKARKDDTNYVKADQDQREVACEPVEVIDPLLSPDASIVIMIPVAPRDPGGERRFRNGPARCRSGSHN